MNTLTALLRRNFKLPIALSVALVVISALRPANATFANAGGGHDVTFTKWVTSEGTLPVLLNMAGIVGGDVGPGTYSGEVLSLQVNGDHTFIEALYHFHGQKHDLTAHLTVVENSVTGTAAMTGVVIEGWQRGAAITGGYTVYATCPLPTPGNLFGTLCFQGGLHLKHGLGH